MRYSFIFVAKIEFFSHPQFQMHNVSFRVSRAEEVKKTCMCDIQINQARTQKYVKTYLLQHLFTGSTYQ